MKLCFFSSSSSPPLSSKLSRVSLNTPLPLLVISFFPSIPLFSFFSQSVFPPILSLSSHFPPFCFSLNLLSKLCQLSFPPKNVFFFQLLPCLSVTSFPFHSTVSPISNNYVFSLPNCLLCPQQLAHQLLFLLFSSHLTAQHPSVLFGYQSCPIAPYNPFLG